MDSPFRAIAEFTYDWESWISVEGRLLWVNGAVERLTGYSVAECLLMQDYPLPLVHPADRPAVAEVLRKAGQGHAGNHFEFRVSCKDNKTRWAAISWQPIAVDGKNVGFRSSVRDIDERKQMEQELHAAVRRAEEASHAKTQFLANVTHELRTPLQSIIGYGQLLVAAELPQPLRSYVGTVLQQSEHLEHLVSELLDYSALQAGMLSLRPEPFAPEETVAAVVRGLQPLADNKGLALACNIKVQEVMLGDARRFAQVLTNIISNAIQYTSNGQVQVHAVCVSKDRKLRVHVDDTGPGLPKGKNVFEPFRQGPQTSGHQGGVGLGLALSRQLCVRMGGSLVATKSKLGGARLTVTLPLVAPGARPHVTHFETADSLLPTNHTFAAHHPLRVLVLDDVRAAREFLVEALRVLGYQAISAASADEAFRLVEQSPIDVGLVDIQMPDVDGWTAARGLRARLGNTAYLVALTAQTDADDAARLKDSGFDGFASKPIKIAGLQALLAKASRHVQSVAVAEGGIFDQARWTEMSALTTSSGRSLLEVMCIRVAEALPEVLERMEKAFQTPLSNDLARAIHEIGGLFALVGASRAQALAARCEQAVESNTFSLDQLKDLQQLSRDVLAKLR